jgi:hypothetical protein
MKTKFHSRTFTLHERRFLFETPKEQPKSESPETEAPAPATPAKEVSDRAEKADKALARAEEAKDIKLPKAGVEETSLNRIQTQRQVAQLDKELRSIDAQIKNGQNLPPEELAKLEAQQAEIEDKLKEITPEPVTNKDRLQGEMKNAMRNLRNAKDLTEMVVALFELFAVIGEFIDQASKRTLNNKIVKPGEEKKEDDKKPTTAEASVDAKIAGQEKDGEKKPIPVAELPKKVEEVRIANAKERTENTKKIAGLTENINGKTEENKKLVDKKADLEKKKGDLVSTSAPKDEIQLIDAEMKQIDGFIKTNQELIASLIELRKELEKKNEELKEEEKVLDEKKTEFADVLKLIKDALDEIVKIMKEKKMEKSVPKIDFLLDKDGIVKLILGNLSPEFQAAMKSAPDVSIAVNNGRTTPMTTGELKLAKYQIDMGIWQKEVDDFKKENPVAVYNNFFNYQLLLKKKPVLDNSELG